MVLQSSSPHITLINPGTKEQLKATSFRRSILRSIVFHVISLFCAGVPYALVLWNEVLGIYWQYVVCPIEFADVLILKDIHGQKYAVYIQVEDVSNSFPLDFSMSNDSNDDENTKLCKGLSKCVRYFKHHHIKYLWNQKQKQYEMLSGLPDDVQLSDFHNEYTGFSATVQDSRLELYGPNSIEVEVISYWRILKDEVLNPFYLFEIFSVVVWIVDEYIYYAICVLIMSFISLAVALYEIRRQSQMLHDMAVSSNTVVVSVCRFGEVFENVSATKLVPGDLISIPPTGCMMPCDAVLIAGTCIVDESMLTGESVPVTKTAAPELDEVYSVDLHNKHTLYCGTTILQTRYYGQDKVLAVVTQTGFTTAKGELVRSILYPKPIGFKFYMDSIRFMLILLFVALCGICHTVYIYITKEATVAEIIIRACDMLTIVVPPAMPAAMTVGIVYAQNRLQKQGIFCISPQRINVCGKIKRFCFDKTGTLTEGGLDFWGVIPRRDDHFGDIVRDPGLHLDQKDPILITLAACHTLTLIEGRLIGDPLEIKMFESTRWILEEPGADATRYDVMAPTVVKPVTRDTFLNLHGLDFAETTFEMPFHVGIVRQFPFSSTLQRMSVIVRSLGNRCMEVLCKGSPEKVTALCRPETIPNNLNTVLRSYAVRGFRVLALAHRVLDKKVTWHQMHRMKRNQLEANLDFLGLLIMHNTLKPESKGVIKELRRAKIHCVMVTGDNLLTAINVARDCDMLPVSERVILVSASPPSNGESIKVHFSLAEMYDCYEASSGLSAFSNSEESMMVFSSSWQQATASRLETVQQLVRNRSEVIEVEQDDGERFHFATCGKTWALLRRYAPELIPRLVVRGTVFARMAPDQKTQLIDELQQLGYVVGMCGDGANDCGALKAAHVGVSLSEAEASAAAPFTSKTNNISCIPKLIREGRCALVTSFGVFKYMALYSLIQFISVMILYSLRTTLGDYMFLYHDLVITTTVAFLMGKTAPYDEIVAERPRGSLMSASNILSLVMQIALTAAIQLGGLLILMVQPWYVPIHPVRDEDIISCWEVTVIFYISSFQYLILALAFSYGPPYRQPFYTNTMFLLSLIVLSSFNLVLTFLPIGPLASFFEVIGIKVEPDLSSTFKEEENMFLFRVCIVLIVLLNTVVSFIIENLASKTDALKKFPCELFKGRTLKNHYKLVEEELTREPAWPPINDGDFFHDMSM